MKRFHGGNSILIAVGTYGCIEMKNAPAADCRGLWPNGYTVCKNSESDGGNAVVSGRRSQGGFVSSKAQYGIMPLKVIIYIGGDKISRPC
jgi:hypothetical protein